MNRKKYLFNAVAVTVTVSLVLIVSVSHVELIDIATFERVHCKEIWGIEIYCQRREFELTGFIQKCDLQISASRENSLVRISVTRVWYETYSQRGGAILQHLVTMSKVSEHLPRSVSAEFVCSYRQRFFSGASLNDLRNISESMEAMPSTNTTLAPRPFAIIGPQHGRYQSGSKRRV